MNSLVSRCLYYVRGTNLDLSDEFVADPIGYMSTRTTKQFLKIHKENRVRKYTNLIRSTCTHWGLRQLRHLGRPRVNQKRWNTMSRDFRLGGKWRHQGRCDSSRSWVLEHEDIRHLPVGRPAVPGRPFDGGARKCQPSCPLGSSRAPVNKDIFCRYISTVSKRFIYLCAKINAIQTEN